MSGYWRNLQSRERVLLIAGAVLLSVVLIYTLVWATLSSERSSLRSSVRDQRQLVAWMKAAALEVGRLKNTASASRDGSSRSLLSRVDSTAKELGLSGYIKRIQPDGTSSVRIWFEGVAFDEAMAWLGEILKEGDSVTQDLVVERTADEGIVNLRLVLEGLGQ